MSSEAPTTRHVQEPAPPEAPDAAGLPDVADVADAGERVLAAVATVVAGKTDVVRAAWTTVLAGGHLLVEDVPGVGKTLLARALGRAAGVPLRRIQCTPDLLPSDITGTGIYDQRSGEFVFHPGPVFASVVIADEINRATPRAQSALLEAMAEGQVTVDGTSHPLPDPFCVVATQNPVEMSGTYALPEAQRDRFMMRLSMGYPTAGEEFAMLGRRLGPTADGAGAVRAVPAVTTATEVAAMVRAVARVRVSDAVRHYVVAVVAATRRDGALDLGASPRAGLHLLCAARARAALEGRGYVLPDDVKALAVPVLAHRLVLSARAATRDPADVVDRVVAATPQPRS